MSIILEVLQIVAPVFLLALIGFVWVRIGWAFDLQFVTRLAMTLSIPCLIFMALMRADIEPAALEALVLATLAAYAGVALLILALVLLFRLERRTYLAPLIFGNTGNIGLPVALFAYGQEGLALAVVVFAIMAILSFTLGIWMVSGSANPVTALKEPMVLATFLGGLFMVQGWRLPGWTENTLDLIGQLGIPLMLITLGVAIARLRPSDFGKGILLSVIKVGICVAVPWGAALYFGLDQMALGVLVLQVAMPVAVTSYMLAEKYNAKSGDVASLVVTSTLLAVFAIPAILTAVL
ncbi:MAG: AEC family transporter [Pseudomonadota bacterium]